MDIHSRFHEILYDWYPGVAERGLALSPLMLSPYQVPIADRTLALAQQTMAVFERLAELPEYATGLPPVDPRLSSFCPQNRGVLTSFDFHIDEDGTPRLIEINTNAAFGLLGEVLYAAQGLYLGTHRQMSAQLCQAFQQERESFFRPLTVHHAAIIDQDPPRQNFFIEFLMYQKLFADLGWQTVIDDVGAFAYHSETMQLIHKASGQIIDLVYNRYTDFYLEEAKSHELRQAYYHGAALFTPHPREYWLMADKSRLVQLSQESILSNLPISEIERNLLRQVVPHTLHKSDFANSEDLWQQRKGFFLKPATSHGSKAVYKGASVSRKVFEQMWLGDFLAQETIPPSLFQPQGEAEPFKVDIRCITYRTQLQMVLARLYRGQVTNFKTPGGGIAVVKIEP